MIEAQAKSKILVSSVARLANRFRRPEIGVGRGAAYGSAAILAGFLCGQGPLGDYLKTRLDLPLLYRAREWLGRGPELSQKMRVVLFDDAAMAWLGAAEPSLVQWSSVLDAISARKPAAIIVNKVFGALPAGGTADDAKNFVKILKEIRERDRVPVVAGAYFLTTDNKYRAKISATSVPSLSPVAWGLDPSIPLATQLSTLGMPSQNRSGDFLYGPHPELLPAFSGVGAVNYQSNMMVPLVFRGPGNSLVPHLVLAGFSSRTIGDGFLFINGAKVSLNHSGEMLPDIITTAKISRSAVSLKHFLDPASRVLAAKKSVFPGDTVFIGNSSSVDAADSSVPTPLGQMPASIAIASVANSFVAGRLTREAPIPAAWWCLGAVAGFFCALYLPVATGLLALGLMGLAWIAVSITVFAVGGIAVPWLAPVIAGALGGMLVVFRKLTLARVNSIQVAAAYDGRISQKALAALTRHPERLELACREVPVSVMFIDIAGFSLFAERRGAQEVFDYLREVLGDFSGLIQEHRGVVDKSLGDGLLAYFGQDVDSESDQMDHAVRAFQCAVHIQQAQLLRNQGALAARMPVLPVRIGVNSATCLLGDLGTEKRIDVTIVGGGVNFAKRLEDACDPGTILVSSTTYSLAVARDRPTEFVRKFVRVKHMNALVEAFEFDPLASDPHLKVKLIEAFRRTIAVERVDRRWVVPTGKVVTLKNELGTTELVNFSGRGFAVRLPALFARGSLLTFEFESEPLRQDLSVCGIQKIQAEVRWSHGSGSNVVHGFSVNGFSEEQSASFNKLLMEHCFSDDEFKLPRLG